MDAARAGPSRHFLTYGDYIHISSTPPRAASAHGWWLRIDNEAALALVRVQLQIKRAGLWLDVGPPDEGRDVRRLAAAGSSTEHLVSGRNWFSTSDPAARTAVHLTVEPGEVDAVRPVATTILESLQRLDTGPFAVETLLPGSRAVVPVPPVVDDLWLGSGRHPVTLACSTPEWSIDAVGWLVGVVAAACTAAGVRTSVLVSAVRAGSAAA